MTLANAGIPMLGLHLPAMVALLVPITLAEYFIARRLLDPRRGRVWGGVVWANLATTFLGIPLTWGAMLLLNVATTGSRPRGVDTLPDLLTTLLLQSTWLDVPKEGTEWLLQAATLVLMVPYFFVSVYTERLVLRAAWPGVERRTVERVSWRANLASYGALAALVAASMLVVASR